MLRRSGPLLILIALAALFHGPRLGRPFGLSEVNAGLYFGLFQRQFADFGFMPLRGILLGEQRLTSPASGVPYLNHPPGVAWMTAAAGPDEASIRLCGVVLALLAAVALFLLLQARTRTFVALTAAACLLGTPSVTLYSQVSYEVPVLACGLWLWLATERLGDPSTVARARWRAAQIAAALFGPWMDWSFVFWCAALLPLVAHGGLVATGRRLAVPALGSLVAVVLIVAWRVWASHGPLLNAGPVDSSLGEMVRTTILARPAVTKLLVGGGGMLVTAATLPLVLAGTVGWLWLWRRVPRLALATLIAGLGQPLLFANHAVNHVHFFCYTCAALVIGLAQLTTLPGVLLRRVAQGVLLGTTGFVWWASHAVVSASDTTFFADVGRVLSAATRPEGAPPGARPQRVVGTNLAMVYPYYVDTSAVLVRPTLVHEIDTLVGAARRAPWLIRGARYLWFKDVGGDALGYFQPTAAGLKALLGPLPKRRVPELETRLVEPRLRADYVFPEVYLVDVTPDFAAVVLHAPATTTRAQTLATDLRADHFAVPLQRTVAIDPADTATAVPALTQATHVIVLWDAALVEDPARRAAVCDLGIPTSLQEGKAVLLLYDQATPPPKSLPQHRLLMLREVSVTVPLAAQVDAAFASLSSM